MTAKEPDGPYVYQPYGSVTHPEHDATGRLWGVSGVHMLATIKGLTKIEAVAIASLLRGNETVMRFRAECPTRAKQVVKSKLEGK